MTYDPTLDDLQIQEYIDTNMPIRCKLTVIGASPEEADRIASIVRDALAKAGVA